MTERRNTIWECVDPYAKTRKLVPIVGENVTSSFVVVYDVIAAENIASKKVAAEVQEGVSNLPKRRLLNFLI